MKFRLKYYYYKLMFNLFLFVERFVKNEERLKLVRQKQLFYGLATSMAEALRMAYKQNAKKEATDNEKDN
jgi:hypothetical protein